MKQREEKKEEGKIIIIIITDYNEYIYKYIYNLYIHVINIT